MSTLYVFKATKTVKFAVSNYVHVTSSIRSCGQTRETLSKPYMKTLWHNFVPSLEFTTVSGGGDGDEDRDEDGDEVWDGIVDGP